MFRAIPFIRHQAELFFIALGFLTRIPVPATLEYSQEKLNNASRYFTLVGLVIGLLCAAVFLTVSWMTHPAIGILFSMIAGIFITGAFHEDGLADTADGLGGGWTVEQKLTIMKDSRLGTYGAVALWFALSAKFLLLSHISSVALAIIAAHTASRVMPIAIMFTMTYVTDPDKSKVKPLAESRQLSEILFNLFLGGSALLLLGSAIFPVMISLVVLFVMYRRFLDKQMGGYTGDALGASQQLAELTIYFVLVVINDGLSGGLV